MKFTDANRIGSVFYLSNYQRHHLIPLHARHIFVESWDIKSDSASQHYIDDFNKNGLMLPNNELESARTGLPMHRGPHPRYNALVIERMMTITRKARLFKKPREQYLFLDYRTKLLQKALRKALIGRKLGRLVLNKRDPFQSSANSDPVDAVIDRIWCATKNLG